MALNSSKIVPQHGRRIFLALCVFSLLFGLPSFGKPKLRASREGRKEAAQWPSIEERLKKEKFSESFIRLLRENYDVKSRIAVLKLNYLTFKRSPIRKNKISSTAIRKTAAFLSKHPASLAKAEKKYGVSPEIISALLWLETQHGVLKGRFHVASVFLHLLQSEDKNTLNEIKNIARKHPSFKDMSKEDFEETFNSRAKRKSEWAVEQLKEVESMAKKDAKSTMRLRGSFAGAFGLPQFIPSSFNAFAVANKPGKTPDLFDDDDAILSVAHYLNAYGWDKDKAETHLTALFQYNNSTDYAKTIVELAQAAKKRSRKTSQR